MSLEEKDPPTLVVMRLIASVTAEMTFLKGEITASMVDEGTDCPGSSEVTELSLTDNSSITFNPGIIVTGSVVISVCVDVDVIDKSSFGL